MRSSCTHRTTCRLCDSTRLVKIIAMPACPPVDNYRFAYEPEIDLPAFPMDLYQCQDCGHAQLLDVVDPQILYGNYIYTSARSPDLNAHFERYADVLVQFKGLTAESLVIDIGSNDGLFLAKLQARGVGVIGVDASVRAAELAERRGIHTVVGYIERPGVVDALLQHGPAAVVTANNVFSHADDLRGFLRAIKRLMKLDGLFVFEVGYLGDLVKNRLVDYIYHEHLAHHSVAPLQRFLATEGLKLFRVDRVSTKGGSIRCWAEFQGRPHPIGPEVDHMIAHERATGLYDQSTYAQLYAFIKDRGEAVKLMVGMADCVEGPVASYGASATATVLNALFDVNRHLSFIVDDNPARHGRLSPGARILVEQPSQLVERMPTACLISSWRFADMIIARNQDYLAKGGKFIVPLPDLRVVTA